MLFQNVFSLMHLYLSCCVSYLIKLLLDFLLTEAAPTLHPLFFSLCWLVKMQRAEEETDAVPLITEMVGGRLHCLSCSFHPLHIGLLLGVCLHSMCTLIIVIDLFICNELYLFSWYIILCVNVRTYLYVSIQNFWIYACDLRN